MNPITNIRNQNAINKREIDMGIAGGSGKSWHDKYSDSAWVYIGGLPYDLNEGDIITVFSQYGEIVNVNLIRDRKTGKSKGFAFVCYQDQRSTILAVDNLNGIKLLKRMIRVDHVAEYKVPKYKEDIDEETIRLWQEGCAPKPINRQQQEQDNEDEVIIPKRRSKLNKDGVLELSDDVAKKMKEEEKRLKKEKKRAKKEKKKREKLESIENSDAAVKTEDLCDTTSWKNQKRPIESTSTNDEDFYGSNEHFKFGKPRKEIPAAPTHNLRPDFEKADWRDIEMWKAVREKEKQEKGDTQSNWKEEEHYLPKRFHR
ncbi:unnamed protein product [Anisakis simplex]|uniref:RNA-binding motif protein, X-linked 2 (inferred by orthology to a human protein) n=1 Tax=Anisakis simplex TaxID=6269 RepID=A0A0M3JYB1_ANISI|nr:unnamed protein product [Anisakis simplex]